MAPYPKETKPLPDWNDLFKLEMAEAFMSQSVCRNVRWVPAKGAIGLKGVMVKEEVSSVQSK